MRPLSESGNAITRQQIVRADHVERHQDIKLNEETSLARLRQIRKRVVATGVVQGVGFRPFVWRRAKEAGLVGWVRNDSSGVTIEVQGGELQVARFLSGFEESLPPLAQVDDLDAFSIELASDHDFQILESDHLVDRGTSISPEISICVDCLRELNDEHDRRFRYPFINCTNCGPRFTIVDDIPYDRPLTSMKSFPMCEACQREYEDPSDRRFHAQPNACSDCGPQIWFVADSDDRRSFELCPGDGCPGENALKQFARSIAQGDVVAVKGVGGFHLACDAQTDQVIETLRERKGRVEKPFAVMVRDVGIAEQFAIVDDHERLLLTSNERPIVLLRKQPGCDQGERFVSELVAPGNNFIGVMLPYSPLHHLLTESCPALVLTSGNISDEPIVRTNFEAYERLGQLADSFLLHDRGINVVCDDSVVRCVDDNVLPIRRSRGYVPLPVRLNASGPGVLAVGGEIKSTFCVTRDEYAFVSQHIGDMGNLETLDAMRRSIDHFLKLFRVDVKGVVADLHPGYLSGQWAAHFAKSSGVPLIRVQHHYAHIVSLMVENAHPPGQPIIGCCFDGTGFGTDEAIWGGEFMIADESGYRRIAHLSYIPLPGGDTSIRRPYRVALAHLWAAGEVWSERLPCLSSCSSSETTVLRQQLDKNLNCVPTSSMGRLFDAVASLIGVRQEVTYEAQAAMEMEALAAEVIECVDPDAYGFSIHPGECLEIGCQSIIQQICRDLRSGIERRVIAAQFHHAVAKMVTEVAKLASREVDTRKVGLTGGVFQNVLLLELTKRQILENGFQVLTHSVLPPNDGGIALGQAVVARNSIR